MADIFLSYAREDVARVRLIAKALESSGWSVWWDRSIPPGRDFNAYIQQQLDAARCIVVLWSKASVASPFVRDEAGEGIDDGRLVPALIDEVKPPLGFRQIQAANLSDWQPDQRHDEFERLIGSIAAIVPPAVEASIVAKAAPAPAVGAGLTSFNRGLSRMRGSLRAPVLGIDFGLTNIGVAIKTKDGSALLPWSATARFMPAVVTFTGDGGAIFGEAAKRQAITNPKRTVFDIGRLLGRTYSDVRDLARELPYTIVEAEGGAAHIRIEDSDYSPASICALLLEQVRQKAETSLGASITSAVITVPASYSHAQRNATKDAAGIAGFEAVHLIDEPTAAAIGFGVNERTGTTLAAVCDWGGAKYNLSLVQVSDGTIEINRSKTLYGVGGDAMDARIADWIAHEIHARQGIDVSRNAGAMQRLRDAAELAKIALSRETTTLIDIPTLSTTPLRLGRGDFEDLIEDLLDDVNTLTRQTLAETNIDPSSITQVVPVGATMRVPSARSEIARIFGNTWPSDLNPEDTVALGAALEGARLVEEVARG